MWMKNVGNTLFLVQVLLFLAKIHSSPVN